MKRLFLILLLVSQPAFALKRVPISHEDVVFSYAPLVKKTAPAVVNIYTSKHVSMRTSPFLGDPFFGKFFGNNFGSLLGRKRKKVINSLGSGVLVDKDGLVITNYHVIKESSEIKVVLSDKREFEAETVLIDPKTDLALLKINSDDTFAFLKIADEGDLEIGDLVLAIGNPFGVGQTVTSGIVSALARTTVGITDFEFFIQTDAAINPGNSGGALVNMYGQLVGVNTAIYTKTGGSNGIGFATPANMASVVLSNYKMGNKRVVRPWLGASTQNVTPEIAESIGLAVPSGILIRSVYPKSSADRAGLMMGDVITKIDEYPVSNEQELKFRIATYRIGGSASFSIIRNNKRFLVKVSMEAPIENPPRNTTLLEGGHILSGAIVANLSPALAEETNVKHYEGVIITEIQLRTRARRFFERNDIILAVNKIKITDVHQLQKVLDTKLTEWQLSIKRGNKILKIEISTR